MAVNLLTKYAAMIDEHFTVASLTQRAINTDVEFTGAKTVKVFSTPTVAMTDYTRSGSSRYGTPSELENAEQEMTMSRDRAFTYTVDKMNDEESGGSLNAGKRMDSHRAGAAAGDRGRGNHAGTGHQGVTGAD